MGIMEEKMQSLYEGAEHQQKQEWLDSLPKFVSLNGTALRLVDDYYYRDGGEWKLNFKQLKNGSLVSDIKHLGHLHNNPLIPISKEEWRKDNGEFAPKDI